MMNDRELATFVLLAAVAAFAIANRSVRPSVLAIFKAMASPKALAPMLLLAGGIVGAVWLAHSLGLWTSQLVGATVLWFLLTGVAWLLNISDAGKDDNYFKRRMLEVLKFGALFEFFVNTQSFSLPVELVLQVVLTLLIMLDLVAKQKEETKPVAKLTTSLLVLIGFGIVLNTVVHLVLGWSTVDKGLLLNEFLLPIWLAAASIGCIYPVAVLAGYEDLFLNMRFWNERRPIPWRTKLGVALELRLKLVDVGEFRGMPAKTAARSDSVSAARQAVQDFRAERAADLAARAAARQRLVDNAGLIGVDADGRLLDRREFAETKNALMWLAACHMGWYRNDSRPDEYREDLLEVIAGSGALEHIDAASITMRVRADKQSWYAYRRTPSDHYFAIGADGPPPSQWFFDGSKRPSGYPRPGGAWISFMDETRPEWDEEDPT